MKAVLVHAGARDGYQVARALYDCGALRALVTNVYVGQWVREHYRVAIPRKSVRTPLIAKVAFAAMRLLHVDLNEMSDRSLGMTARKLASRMGDVLFAYSYYAYHAFRPGAQRPRGRILFQLHPHPESVRRILREEMERTPSARDSLLRECEVGGRESRIASLTEEPHLADCVLVASSYTASTLTQHSVPASKIQVVPYGVDATLYPERSAPPARTQAFTVTWVGTLSQRKGLSYLLDSMRILRSRRIQVRLRGRGFVDKRLLAGYSDLALDIQTSLTRAQIVSDLHSSDLYVLPSLVEGFGQSILEAMSCGVPVLTTAHTCAPDLIQHGREGFIVPVRNAFMIAQYVDWGASNRNELAEMGRAAAVVARSRPWHVFRERIQRLYAEYSSGLSS